MEVQTLVEGVLAAAAILLLARDVHRAWRDSQRRPSTLLGAALVAVLLIGALGGREQPSPWWLMLPGAILAWEAVRGWRRTPRCHYWEGGIGAFAASLLLAVAGFAMEGGAATALFAAAIAASALGIGLLWHSYRREPRPWRANDPLHYERRASERPGND